MPILRRPRKPGAGPLVARAAIAVLLAAIIGGCEPTNLYVAHTTVLGVNGAMNADQSSGHLIVGYDRKFAAVVPKSVDTEDGKEAMSVLSCSDVKVDGIFLAAFTEYLATGRAAQGFANKVTNPKSTEEEREAIDQMFDCYTTSIPSETVRP
jgi:hypothetical protein